MLVRESLYRWKNWTIVEASDKWTKADATRIDFTVDLKPGDLYVTLPGVTFELPGK